MACAGRACRASYAASRDDVLLELPQLPDGRADAWCVLAAGAAGVWGECSGMPPGEGEGE